MSIKSENKKKRLSNLSKKEGKNIINEIRKNWIETIEEKKEDFSVNLDALKDFSSTSIVPEATQHMINLTTLYFGVDSAKDIIRCLKDDIIQVEDDEEAKKHLISKGLPAEVDFEEALRMNSLFRKESIRVGRELLKESLGEITLFKEVLENFLQETNSYNDLKELKENLLDQKRD